MSGLIPPIRQRLQNTFIRFTEPHSAVTDERCQFQMRLLAGLALGLLPALLLAVPALLYVQQPQAAVIALLGAAAQPAIYLLARSPRCRLAIRLAVALSFVLSFATIYTLPNSHVAVMLLIPVYVASIFCPALLVFPALLLSSGGVLLIAALREGDWAALPLTLLFALLVALIITFRSYVLESYQQRLQQHNERFRAAIDASPADFYLLLPLHNAAGAVPDFQIVEANRKAAQTAGMSLSELVGRRLAELPGLPAPLHEQLMQALENGGTLEDELALADGHYQSWQIVPLEDGLLSVTLQDITRRRQADDHRLELSIERERVRMLRRFIGDVSHDLMTPITTINTSLYLLQKAPDEERRDRAVERVEKQVGALSAMIQNMIDLSRLDLLATDEFSFYTVDLNALVQHVVDAHRSPAAARSLTLALEEVDQIPGFLMDEQRIEVALSNLINNAINYSPEGASIDIRLTLEGGCAVVAITDRGPGIEAQDLPHIFERFYKGAAHRPAGGGAGLGLTIALKIVEAHSGYIEVDSTLGQGSTFRAILPVVVPSLSG